MSIWFAYFAELEMELGYSAQKHLFCTGVHHELCIYNFGLADGNTLKKYLPAE